MGPGKTHLLKIKQNKQKHLWEYKYSAKLGTMSVNSSAGITLICTDYTTFLSHVDKPDMIKPDGGAVFRMALNMATVLSIRKQPR